MLSGDNGILQKATTAKENTDNAQIREKIRLAYNSALTKDISDQKGEVQKSTFEDELKSEFPGKTINISESADKKEWVVTIDGVTENVPIGKDTPKVATLPSEEGTKPYFPSSEFSQVAGTDLSTGLVITDEVDKNGNSIGNEYVWIEVPRTEATYGNLFNLNYDFNNMTEEEKNTAYTAIATALRTYCSKDASGTELIAIGANSASGSKKTTRGYLDTWYEGCGIESPQIYMNLYNKMLKSIYENGGFYIGKYEAGTDTARGNKADSIEDLIPLSKINMYPINYVTCSQAQLIATATQNTGIYNSSLMFGIQWDLVLRHLSNKGIQTSLLTENSSTWGNYYNQAFKIDIGEYSQERPWNLYIPIANETVNKVTYSNTESKKTGTTYANRILLTAGASNINSKKNIYDFAGNLYEFTLENPLQNGVCVNRGGNFSSSGSDEPASHRNQTTTTNADGISRI